MHLSQAAARSADAPARGMPDARRPPARGGADAAPRPAGLPPAPRPAHPTPGSSRSGELILTPNQALPRCVPRGCCDRQTCVGQTSPGLRTTRIATPARTCRRRTLSRTLCPKARPRIAAPRTRRGGVSRHGSCRHSAHHQQAIPDRARCSRRSALREPWSETSEVCRAATQSAWKGRRDTRWRCMTTSEMGNPRKIRPRIMRRLPRR